MAWAPGPPVLRRNPVARRSDLARVCLFLASELAGFVNGAVIPVDGGWSQNGCGSMGDYLGSLA